MIRCVWYHIWDKKGQVGFRAVANLGNLQRSWVSLSYQQVAYGRRWLKGMGTALWE